MDPNIDIDVGRLQQILLCPTCNAGATRYTLRHAGTGIGPLIIRWIVSHAAQTTPVRTPALEYLLRCRTCNYEIRAPGETHYLCPHCTISKRLACEFGYEFCCEICHGREWVRI